MKMNLYAIYDKVAKEYSSPVACVNDGVAVRAFKQQVHEGIRDDYIMCHIGSFDPQFGVIEACKEREVRIDVINFEEIKE